MQGLLIKRNPLIDAVVWPVVRHSVVLGGPVVPNSDAMSLPLVDNDNFNAGYMMRSLHLMPQQIGIQPWKLETDYFVERDLLPTANLEDGTLQFTPKIN